MQDFADSPPPTDSNDPSLDEAILASQRRVFADRPAGQRPGGVSWLDPAVSHGPARLDAALLAVVRSFGASLESDRYALGHSDRVARYAAAVAAAMGLEQEEIETVRLGGYLHDVGRVRVPPGIRTKDGRLTDAEFGVMKKHSVWGLELLEDLELPVDVMPMIRWHHERHDGSGYPDGLKGDEIPLNASIIGIADVYDALTSPRSYQPVMSGSSAMALMQARRGWWRPEVFDGFRRAAEESPKGTMPVVDASEPRLGPGF